MMDWNEAAPQDFRIRVEVDQIDEQNDSIVFPVRVYYRDGTFVFLKPVPVRRGFYEDLKRTPSWRDALMKILRQRVRDDIDRRINTARVSIEDKVDLLDINEQVIS